MPQPTDLVNQSIPFSYLSAEVASNDGNPHQVQLYTDVDGEWLVPTNLATNDQLIQWETDAGNTVNHQFWLQNQTQFLQANGRLRDGSVIYSTEQVREPSSVFFFWVLNQHIPGQRNDVPGWARWRCQDFVPDEWYPEQHGVYEIRRNQWRVASLCIFP